jgi:hypothetical protein
MNRIAACLLVLISLASLSDCFVSRCLADGAASAAVPLFDGETLNGWHGQPHLNPSELAGMSAEQRQVKQDQWNADVKQHWRVENGELVNDGAGVYLVTDKEYRDFDLSLEFKIQAGADSGVYLKGTPQVQIWDPQDKRQHKHGSNLGSGGLWNNATGAAGKDPLVLADHPTGQWNQLRMRQIGARTWVWLNEKLVVDGAIMENYWDRESPLPVAGNIQLQTHGGEIRWRNLMIQEFTSQQANEILASRSDDGFTSLFNGTDLTGWQGALDNYEVVEGAIRCQPGKGGNLLTENEYSNFVVRLEFRLPPAGNNGLAIRSPLGGDAAYQAMTELQVLDTEHPKYANIDPRQAHGSAYGMVAAKRGYLRPVGEWNFQEVTVDGSTIRVELNGTVILDTDLSQVTEFMSDSAHPGKDRMRGYFGFAGHHDPVEFRNVSIRPLTGADGE